MQLGQDRGHNFFFFFQGIQKIKQKQRFTLSALAVEILSLTHVVCNEGIMIRGRLWPRCFVTCQTD